MCKSHVLSNAYLTDKTVQHITQDNKTQDRRSRRGQTACPELQAGRQTDRQKEREQQGLGSITDGQLGQRAAQPLRNGLQLFQLRLLTAAFLTQDLVLQPLVALFQTDSTPAQRATRRRATGIANGYSFCL